MNGRCSGDDEDPNERPDEAHETKPTYKSDELFPVLSEEELIDLPQATYILDKVLAENSVALMYGMSQALKTFLLLDMSLCISHGVRFHGREVKQCAVAYIVAEGEGGIGKRVCGWKQKHSTRSSPFPLHGDPHSSQHHGPQGSGQAHLAVEDDRANQRHQVSGWSLSIQSGEVHVGRR